ESITRERLTFAQIDHLEQAGFTDASPSPGASMQSREIQEEIAACLEGLNDTELEILSLRFGLLNDEPESYRSMAPQFGKSREWIRKTGESALLKLKNALTAVSDRPRDLVLKREKNLQVRLNEFRKRDSKNKKNTQESLS